MKIEIEIPDDVVDTVADEFEAEFGATMTDVDKREFFGQLAQDGISFATEESELLAEKIQEFLRTK